MTFKPVGAGGSQIPDKEPVVTKLPVAKGEPSIVTPEVPVQTDALKTIASQKAALDGSRHEIDPLSADVLKKFMNTQRRQGGDPTPALLAPVYGAPIRPRDFIPHFPIPNGPDSPDMLNPSWKETPAAPVYGAPIRPRDFIPHFPIPNGPDSPDMLNPPFDEAPMAPIYGTPFVPKHEHKKAPFEEALPAPVYGAPIMKHPEGKDFKFAST